MMMDRLISKYVCFTLGLMCFFLNGMAQLKQGINIGYVEDFEKVARLTLISSTETEFNRCKANKEPIILKIKQSKTHFTLHTKVKPFKLKKTNHEQNDFDGYEYLGYYPKLKMYAITENIMSESLSFGSFGLVDSLTGNYFSIVSIGDGAVETPIPSPSGKYLLYHYNRYYEGDNCFIGLLQINRNSTPKKVFLEKGSIDPANFTIDSMRWLNDQTFMLKTFTTDNTNKMVKHFQYYKVVIWEDIVAQIRSQVRAYKSRPGYFVKVDRKACRFALEFKDNTEYRFTEKEEELRNISLNFYITKSGKQSVKIRVYPAAGEKFITSDAMINLSFSFGPDKNSLREFYKEIAKYSLPKDIAAKKLPYYETNIEFDATVPYDYSQHLAGAKDLKKVENIEQKVVAKYEATKKIIQEMDAVRYQKERLYPSIRFFETVYQIDEDDIRFGVTYTSGIFDDLLEDRQMLPIENYEIRYYANGKIVALWDKNNLESELRIRGKVKQEGKVIVYETSDPLFLYMPAGANELKVWE